MNQLNRQNMTQFSAGHVSAAITEELNAWEKDNRVQRLWKSDASLWTNEDEAKWMGWLNLPELESRELHQIKALAEDIKMAGFKYIVVLGMGGSSLCPAMMAKTFGKIEHHPHLYVLDSTDPLQIRHLEDKIELKKTLFIVSSKSGGTLEPNIFKQYFYTRLQKEWGRSEVGDHFLAITDPGTKLEAMAKSDHFRAIFYGVPSVGGRYSALSNFGIVPSGLMGVDVKDFLRDAERMVKACSPIVLPKDNPGVLLGIILGVCAKQGKDKVTLVTSPGIQDLGAWLEQLLAESTGKHGKGLIPIDQESLGKPDVYGQDRVFVYIRLDDAPNTEQDASVTALETAGYVVVRLHVSNKQHLGAELFRWEIATAVAGSVIGINAFNQPDVEASKVRALQLTAEYEETGKIPESHLIFSDKNIQLFTDEINAKEMTKQLVGAPSLEGYLRAHLNRVKPGDYVDLAAFIEMSEEHTHLLQESRMLIRDAKKVATCLGFGPRFLHSTGQDYIGGPNTGVFLQITGDHAEDIEVPDHRYTFGLVITAQAQADFEELVKRRRRALRIHLKNDLRAGLQQLQESIKQALTNE